jgi:hypothetical protein
LIVVRFALPTRTAGILRECSCGATASLAAYFKVPDFTCLRLLRVRNIWNHRNFLFASDAEKMNHNADAKIAITASSAITVIEIPEPLVIDSIGVACCRRAWRSVKR